MKFSDLAITLHPAELDAAGAEIAPALMLRYGAFLQAAIDFMIVAFVIFLFVKAYNRLRKPAEVVEAGPTEEVLLLREIRDSLNK